MANKSPGRPVKFKTVEDLQKVIDEYFEFQDNRAIQVTNKDGKTYMITSKAPYTMAGLARRVGLSRQGLMEYKGKKGFSDAIRAARERIHEDVEERLMDTKNEKGAIFNLKNNFGWKDESKQELEGKFDGNITVSFKSKKDE